MYCSVICYSPLSVLADQQNSVPHLRTRLQLQQAIMKELLQRQAQEKLQRKLQKPKQEPATSSSPVATATSNSIHSAVGNSQLAVVDMMGPASALGNVRRSPNQHSQSNNVAPPSSSSSSLSSSSASIPLPMATTSLTAQLREQLAKITPQQRQLYVQQLSKQSKQQQVNLAASSASSTPAAVTRAGNSSTSVAAVATQAVSVNVQKVSLNSMGGVAVHQIMSRLPVSSNVATTNHMVANSGRIVGASVSPSRVGQVRTGGFVDVKLAPGVNKSASPPISGVGKGKGKVKSEKTAADE